MKDYYEKVADRIMKDYYEKVADRILPKFNEACKSGKCKHPKCECGHCQKNYHVGKVGECTKLNQDLTVCQCKKFNQLKKGEKI